MKNVIISQYKASLNMLTDAIVKCPDGLWIDDSYDSAYWRIVYHTLFYTALYLSENENTFTRWAKHTHNANVLGTHSRDGMPLVTINAYTKVDLLAYCTSITDDLDKSIKNLEADNSGFDWLPMSKLELHLYNIRHIQHHTGQLIERLHQNGIRNIEWLGWGE